MPDEAFAGLTATRGGPAPVPAWRRGRLRSVPVGARAAGPHDGDAHQAEIGFTIGPRHQGRGFATEAARLLLDYLFGARGKHRVVAYCDARNAASAGVLERLGMRLEGHLRESTWAKGEWTDDLAYAVLDREWARGDGSGGLRDRRPAPSPG
jgi:RimJ/RimL family protein N-acetyltransferase